MCAVEDAEPWDFFITSTPRAAKIHRCTECAREIKIKEQHYLCKGLADGSWQVYRTCSHCMAAGEWMQEVCNGWLFGDLHEEMVEHWNEGYASVGFGRLIAGVKRRWHEGADPIPDVTAVRAMAAEMLREMVRDKPWMKY